MGLNRRYFILNRVSIDELEALQSCIGLPWTQRYRLDFQQVLIKVNTVWIANQEFGFVNKLGTEYTLKEIKLIMQNPEWQDEIEF